MRMGTGTGTDLGHMGAHMCARVGGAREMRLFFAWCCCRAIAVAVAVAVALVAVVAGCLQCAPNVNKIFARLP